MTEKEKIDKDFEAMSEVLKPAFDIFHYNAYIGFCIDPVKAEASELSKKAFEYAKEGALKRIENAFPGKSEKEYQKILDYCFRRELLRVVEEKDLTKLESFSFSAEKLIKMVALIQPSSEINKT